MNSSVPPHMVDGSKHNNGVQEKNPEKHAKPLMLQDTKEGSSLSSTAKLHTLEEESDEGNKNSSTDSSNSSWEKLLGNCNKGEKEVSDPGSSLV